MKKELILFSSLVSLMTLGSVAPANAQATTVLTVESSAEQEYRELLLQLVELLEQQVALLSSSKVTGNTHTLTTQASEAEPAEVRADNESNQLFRTQPLSI